ncbi:hypothetical protein B1C81_23805 [Streptomyces sp. HG99]|nr:hypothetical protein B1C81_23805 [Streptomyces sp. HG99]
MSCVSSAATCRRRGYGGNGPVTRPSRAGRWGRPPGPRKPPVNLDSVDPKTRNRIMACVLVLMFVVVALASAFQ